MSQLIAVRAGQGLILAADRRVEVHDGLSVAAHTLQKLRPLGTCGALATGGAAVGISITQKLAREFAERGAVPFDELEARVVSVFRSDYAAFVEKGREWFAAHPDAHRRICLLLGGQGEGGAARAAFYASDDHGMALTRVDFGAVLAMPRRLGLEGALARAAAAGEDINALRDRIVAGFKRIENAGEPVGGPYDLAIIEGRNIRWEEIWRE